MARGKRFGKYLLLQRLGGGGMAEVFKARLHGPEGFEKDLALKLILPQFSTEPEFVKMFIREATLAARLDHANIVRIHEFDRVGKRYYIAMELVEGRDLRKLMARSRELDRRLGLAECLVIAIEVAKGLAFAHGELRPGAEPIVHRDISPHNILVSRAGEVKISDFGIAKLASAAGVTQTGMIKGKVAYMSPEQARADAVDGRSDLFSLGCVLWEMLTGQRLFGGANDLVVLERLKSMAIPKASAYNPDVPPALDALLDRMLARELEVRLASASALLRDLGKVLHGLPAVDRTGLLVELVREMFGDTPRRTTAVMPGPAADSRPEEGTDEIDLWELEEEEELEEVEDFEVVEGAVEAESAEKAGQVGEADETGEVAEADETGETGEVGQIGQVGDLDEAGETGETGEVGEPEEAEGTDRVEGAEGAEGVEEAGETGRAGEVGETEEAEGTDRVEGAGGVEGVEEAGETGRAGDVGRAGRAGEVGEPEEAEGADRVEGAGGVDEVEEEADHFEGAEEGEEVDGASEIWRAGADGDDVQTSPISLNQAEPAALAAGEPDTRPDIDSPRSPVWRSLLWVGLSGVLLGLLAVVLGAMWLGPQGGPPELEPAAPTAGPGETPAAAPDGGAVASRDAARPAAVDRADGGAPGPEPDAGSARAGDRGGEASAADSGSPPSGEKKPSRPIRPPRRYGRLDLNAIPWAEVFWSGRSLGETPLEGIRLPAGKQKLVLKNSSLGKTRTIEVRIAAGKVATHVEDMRK
ncbi:MAG: protein kinase [Deltaproteobacteria bacterium]|nr:protein kinase [Deltaproteobacteria bacterium]